MAGKFLLVSQVFYPDQVSTANLFTILSSILVEDNVKVEVWTAHPSYTEKKRQPSYVEYKGIKIHYLPSSNFRKTSLAGRLCNILTFAISISFKVLFSKEKTAVWTHTTPPFIGIILSGICSFRKRRFIYILQDIFPEGLIRLGKISGRNPFVRIWHNSFMKSLKKSYRIITNGRDLGNWVKDNCKTCVDKVVYIPNFQDGDTIVSGRVEESRFIEQRRLSDKFIVQYSGNMGLWNEMRSIGRAVNKCSDDILFIFVGGGIREKELISEISTDSLKRTLFLPFQPGEEFNNTLNAAHVHLVTLKDNLTGIAVPSKIYGILAAGKPVIAMVPKNSEIALAVEEENCGIVLDPDDVEGLVKTIEQLKNDESLRNHYGKNGRAAFLNKYTARKTAVLYKKILDQIPE